MKSERLKKLEFELADLEQWMKLGLVPKQELARHREEIESLKMKIADEKEKLQFLKENGDLEEAANTKKQAPKSPYPDTPTVSEMDTTTEIHDSEFEIESFDQDTTTMDMGREEKNDEDSDLLDEDDDDPFSDRNRWRRGGIVDPDANEW